MSDSPKNALARLFDSRKFVIVLLVVVAASVLVALDKATFAQLVDLVKWLAGALVASIAAEDVAGKLPSKDGAK
jgi:hypothetical protein